MNGLVAIGSLPTPQPVKAISSIGIGVESTHAGTCARAPFPRSVAVPVIALALIRSRRGNCFFDIFPVPRSRFSAARNLQGPQLQPACRGATARNSSRGARPVELRNWSVINRRPGGEAPPDRGNPGQPLEYDFRTRFANR